MDEKIGYQRIPVANLGAPVHATGSPVVVYGFNVVAEVTGTGPDIRFYDGSDDPGSVILLQVNTAADVPTTVTFPEGITFLNGCFVDVDDPGNLTQVTVFYQTLR